MVRDPSLPLVLPLRRLAVGRRDRWRLHVVRALATRRVDPARALRAFDFKNDEQAFAVALLGRRTHLWLYRSNQLGACGDFVVVDVSCPDRARRTAFVVDLKHRQRLRRGGGGAGVQLVNGAAAVAEIAAASGMLVAPWRVELLTGDGGELLRFFGVDAAG